MPQVIRTACLNLVPLTPALGAADLSGRETLERALRAEVPGGWPPEFFESDKLEWTIDHLEQRPDEVGWWMYYVILRGHGGILVGVAGYKGPPDDLGHIEIGYSILGEFRGRGIATEATLALAGHAFARADVDCVVAHTFPAFNASRNVLEKSGFRHTGPGAESDVIRYELTRTDWESTLAERQRAQTSRPDDCLP